MSTLWLTIGNTDVSREELGLNSLPYPLAYNIPLTALAVEAPSIQIIEYPVALSLDLCVELSHTVSMINELEAEQAIAGFRICIGLAEHFFLHLLKVPPTARDLGTAQYYSRWPDGHNVFSKLSQISWSDIAGQPAELTVGREKSCGEVNFLHAPQKVISFISSFTTLTEGDFISLGSLTPKFEIKAGREILPVTAQISKFESALEIQLIPKVVRL